MKLRFPFWIVVPRSPGESAATGDCAREGQPLLFATGARMTAYLSARKGGDWDVSLVNRYSLSDLLAKLAGQGFESVCVEAAPDGSGGELCALGQIAALIG